MSLLGRMWRLCWSGKLHNALDCYDDKCADIEIAYKLSQKMKELGFTGDVEFDSLYSPCYIGVAIELANKYDIRFVMGSGSHICRAILDKACWTREINRDVSLTALAYCTKPESHDEITEVMGEAHRLEFAICSCLIQARIAGVI